MLAPAKINLALHVVGRRDDGYHQIDTLAVFTRFGDRVTVAPAETDCFTVSGSFANAVPTDESNLALRALAVLRREFGPQTPVAINLEKNLPIASGVGGGSSDAAATLKGLSRLWRLDVSDAELARLGLELGADLPMCLAARPLRAKGIGDELTFADGIPALGMVLANPGHPVSTADVFAGLEKRDGAELPSLTGPQDFHTLCNWLETTRNDLEAPARALQPAIGMTLAALRKAGAHFARMSGSGATCFGLFESGNVAKRAAQQLRERQPRWFVAATRNLSSEEANA